MNRPAIDESLLSAYLDGRVTPDERRVVEARLESDLDWQTKLKELRSVRGTGSIA